MGQKSFCHCSSSYVAWTFDPRIPHKKFCSSLCDNALRIASARVERYYKARGSIGSITAAKHMIVFLSKPVRVRSLEFSSPSLYAVEPNGPAKSYSRGLTGSKNVRGHRRCHFQQCLQLKTRFVLCTYPTSTSDSFATGLYRQRPICSWRDRSPSTVSLLRSSTAALEALLTIASLI